VILIDTNILLDVVTGDPQWADWSQQQLDSAAARDQVAINDVVYAELSIGYATIEELDDMIRRARVINAAIPRPALFLAGKAFRRYRSAGGVRTGVLPDFFIGAHAVISASVLVTRDAARYRAYFPGITLIAPN
jgi:predicted nucleic acid-binding protein